MKPKEEMKVIEVWAHWANLKEPRQMGSLNVIPGRGKEVFSFEYDSDWLKSGHAQELDPSLRLFEGPQYAPTNKNNFGLFMDSAPDRWGRVLMKRRERQRAKEERRFVRELKESDFLLGVYDGNRLGALRFKGEPGGPFLDSDKEYASPPWASLRELENASLQLEQEGAEDDPEFKTWIRILMAPGASLGGARPKATVVDESGRLWMAKFPSRSDTEDKGGWEAVAHELARAAGVEMAPANAKIFSGKHHTFLTKRFDRTDESERIHFASAMTLLQKNDGDDASSGTSYIEIAEFLARSGARVGQDLEELWRRIVFSICISNVDDHLRNHGCLLTPKGWVLSPAYDVNPTEASDGLKLNISETDNAQDLDLAMDVARYFRLSESRASAIIEKTCAVVKGWRGVADKYDIPKSEQDRMESAFRIALVR
jgi:serine/threonine-protein kinase HipA